MRVRYGIFASCLTIGSVLSAQAALAQAQGTGDTDQVAGATGLDRSTIIVTARKREESLLDTPIAITAFDEEKIEALGLQDIRDLPAVTPGFVFEPFQGIPGRFDTAPRFRGIGVNSIAPTRQTASVFVDGIYVANGAQGINLSDVARVEVIKGPQSALFGRNTFGGAINYISKVPGTDFGGDFSARAATRDDYSASLGIEGPIIGEALRFRVSGFYGDKGGQYINPVDGSELGAEETWSVTGTLYAEPTPDIDVAFRVNYYENHDGAPAFGFAGLRQHNCGPFGGTDTFICGDVPVIVAGQNTDISPALLALANSTFRLNGRNLDGLGLDRRSLRASAQFNVRLPGTGVTISSLTGVNYDEVDLLRDADDSGDVAFFSYAGRQFRDLSQEVRVSGASLADALQWSLGGNFFDQRFTSNGNFIIPATGSAGNSQPGQENIRTFGVFGSLEYTFADRLGITLEGRYQIDRVEEDNIITDTTVASKGTFKNFLPRVIVDLQATPDTLLYASYAEGNLPGGFNTAVANLPANLLTQLRMLEPQADFTFDEETLKSYEIGLKHSFGNAGSISLAAFYMDRLDQTVRRSDQLFNPDGTRNRQVNYFINIGASEIKGIEAQADFRVTRAVTVGGTFAYVDSIVKRFETGVYNEVYGTPDASGTRGPRFPEFAGSAYAAYEAPLTETLAMFGRADAFYTGERFASEVNQAIARDGIQVNLRAGVRTDSLRVEAFVTNLTDADHPTGINQFRDLTFATPLFDFSTFGFELGLRDRRQFGVRVSGDF